MTSIKCFLVEPLEREGQNHIEQWKNVETGEIIRVDSHWNLPVGAMYYAPWLENVKEWQGPDGKSLIVITPGGAWMIDSRASNCTRPEDTEHKCWVRHGIPPNITVDKNGNTCNAGAGSIQMGSYHGYLRNGFLQDQ